MKLVCKYCNEEITVIVRFKVEGKIKEHLVCVACFNNYLKTMHGIDVEEDFKKMRRQQDMEDWEDSNKGRKDH